MKVRSYYNLLIIAVLVGCGKSQNRNDLKQELLLGNVKSVKEISYQLTKVKGKLVRGKRKRRFDYIEDFYLEFNKNGKRIHDVTYQKDNSIWNEWFYKYDNDGLLSYKYCHTSNPKSIRKDWVYTYDIMNRINMISSFDTHAKNFYNNKGQVSFVLRYTNRGSSPVYYKEFKEKYYYDENGFLKLNCTYYYGAKWYLYYKYVNDKNGNVLEERISSKLKDLKKASPVEYRYTFDDQGNWITKTLIAYKHPKYIIRRKIVYF